MKNKLLIRALSALSVTMAFTACRVALETDLQNPYESTTRRSSGAQMVLVATLETPDGETKTSLVNSQVLWTAGDQIKVFDSSGSSVTLTLSSGAGEAVGVFAGDIFLSTGPYYAVYPASAAVSLSGTNLTINIPQTQTLTAGSFGNGNNIAVAKITNLDDALHFKNVLGAVCIQLTSSKNATRIRIQSKGNEFLWGSGTVDMSGDDPSLSIASGTTDNQIVEATGSATGTSFYLMLPPNALASGFITQVAVGDNDAMLKEAPASESNKISRSGIVEMPAFDFVSQLPSSFLNISATPFGYWAALGSTQTFTFNKTTSQFASKVGDTNRTFRMQDFSAQKMFSFVLPKAPALGLGGDGFDVTLESVVESTYTDSASAGTFRLVQKTSNAGWFVSEDNTIGFIISLED